MIKIENSSVMNFEAAIRGMRNPLQSWDKSDSYRTVGGGFTIGPNDLDLARRLRKRSDERKFLRQIFVSVDLTAPLYWWKEYDTYKVGTVANSTSTMHRIHAKPFTLDDFSHERMSSDGIELLTKHTIPFLEDCRKWYNTEKDPIRKRAYWDDIIQTLPTSYNQMRTCTLNYENLMNIYHARRFHKLQEWHTLCDWIIGLAYFKSICIDEE